MAASKSSARPSCKKNTRCPTPHRGAVRNWSGPALPCVMSSANPSPIWCNKRSENRLACTLLNPGALTVNDDAPVVIEGVWHSAHFTTLTNRFWPFWIDGEQLEPVQAGVG